MKCMIIDDLPIARKGMRRLIASREELELSGAFESAADAISAIKADPPELLFLDIRMPGISGLDFARFLPPETMVIFTTAFSEYAVESYRLNAIDYLVKPIDPERFNIAVDKALENSRNRQARLQLERLVSSSGNFITIKSDRRFLRLRPEEILFVEGCKDMVVFHTSDSQIISRATLKSVEENLPAEKFLRVNKSYIVNRDKITSFDSNDICIGTYEISIGPTYRDSVMAFLLP
ncbi:MAG: LytTR family DNA-binding domain-containing protein [Muribaculaceae bacterium]|nr:LytTR family DNA-binding domain-containing protein [Muribaculaceae bacterium]